MGYFWLSTQYVHCTLVDFKINTDDFKLNFVDFRLNMYTALWWILRLILMTLSSILWTLGSICTLHSGGFQLNIVEEQSTLTYSFTLIQACSVCSRGVLGSTLIYTSIYLLFHNLTNYTKTSIHNLTNYTKTSIHNLTNYTKTSIHNLTNYKNCIHKLPKRPALLS